MHAAAFQSTAVVPTRTTRHHVGSTGRGSKSVLSATMSANSTTRTYTRRAMLHGGLLCTMSVAMGNGKPAQAIAMPLSEASDILKRARVDVDVLKDTSDMVTMRQMLRAGAYGRLRVAVAAYATPVESVAGVAKAGKAAIQAIEKVDVAALRASRGQTSNTDVGKALDKFASCLDEVLKLIS